MTDLPEAPASVTYSITSPNGFPVLFTLRETTGTKLMEKMVKLEEELLSKGFKPQEKKTFPIKREKEYVEGRICPQDGGRLVKAKTQAGKEFYKCENSKWNPVTKKAEGCTYVDWLNSSNNQNGQASY